MQAMQRAMPLLQCNKIAETALPRDIAWRGGRYAAALGST
jgi:hypothetical protein